MGIRGPQRIVPPFKGEHLERAWTSQPTLFFPKSKPVPDEEGEKEEEERTSHIFATNGLESTDSCAKTASLFLLLCGKQRHANFTTFHVTAFGASLSI